MNLVQMKTVLFLSPENGKERGHCYGLVAKAWGVSDTGKGLGLGRKFSKVVRAGCKTCTPGANKPQGFFAGDSVTWPLFSLPLNLPV